MEEKFKKAIEEASSLADKMLSEPAEFASEFNIRRKHLAKINVEKKWINFWFTVNYKKIISVSAAAAVIILSSILFNLNTNSIDEGELRSQVNIMPATGSVVLKLASGELVELDSGVNAQNKLIGVKVDVGNSVISYADDSTSLAASGISNIFKSEYNQLSVPKGRSYSVILSDGTKVYINSMSKLYYPVEFNGTERRVKIEGEAYFEVTKNENKPFVVETKSYSVKVLGTKFNINAYPEEKLVTTTLISGLVEINEGNDVSVKITPGKQLRMDKETKQISVEEVDTELYISWIDNVLRIQDTRLEDILNILKRRYDVDIKVEDYSVLNEKFTGKVPLNDNLLVILEQLEKVSQIKFTINERTITVRSKYINN
ncbi:MAG: FecR family protein [Bacteroidales bacterium]|jgi:hypothetical protein|nr:FecR family protein [Bacteroidales bacterium]